MCKCPRDLWARVIISWLGANKSEKVRRSYFSFDDVEYAAFKDWVITYHALQTT